MLVGASSRLSLPSPAPAMRAFSFLLVLLSLLLACASAVDVPFKWCGSSSDDATISSIVSNEFPPIKGDTLSLNVTGNLSKEVTSGTYAIGVTVGGISLPELTGDISAFLPLPWPTGPLNFTYAQTIPDIAPSGNYVVKISAVDQDGVQIFCISIAFALKARGEVGEYTLMDGGQQRLLERVSAISRLQPLSNTLQRLRNMGMPKMKSVKGNNRRL